MRKGGILGKLIEWDSLTRELCARYHTEPPTGALPTLIRDMLEVASEGQQHAFREVKKADKQAAKARAPKEERKQKGRKPRVAVKARDPEKPLLQESLIRVMSVTDAMSIEQIVAKVRENGWAPESSNLNHYAGMLLSKNEHLFTRAKDVGIGKGFYRLRPDAAEKWEAEIAKRKRPLPPNRVPLTVLMGTSKKIVQPAPVNARDLVVEFLIGAPKSYDESFGLTPIVEKTRLPSADVKKVLADLWKVKILSNRGSSRWRIASREKLKELLAKKTNGVVKTNGVNGAAAAHVN